MTLRSGFMNDELGSSIIASRIVRDLMNLCFLMEQQYAPYPKWFGTAFKKLHCASTLLPVLWNIQTARSWKDREDALCTAYIYAAGMHNNLAITEKLSEDVSFFHDRPFKVIHGERFAQAIVKQIDDPTIRRLSEKRLIGGIDQITDNTDFRCLNEWSLDERSIARNALRTLFMKLVGRSDSSI